MQGVRLLTVRIKACNMAREKKSANAERRADTRAVACAESSPMLVRNYCGKGERELSVQSGYLVHHAVCCAVVSAETYAEIRAVVRVEDCAVIRAERYAERMAPMPKSMQLIMQM